MKTRMEQKALETRQEDPETLKAMMDHHRQEKGKQLRLTYPDGRQKIVNVSGGVNMQKMMEHCDSQGVKAELVEDTPTINLGTGKRS